MDAGGLALEAEALERLHRLLGHPAVSGGLSLVVSRETSELCRRVLQGYGDRRGRLCPLEGHGG
jgi:hypothetical protein